MPSSRYLHKFESLDAVYSFTFPLFSYEYDQSAELRLSEETITGRDFPLDLLYGRLAPFGNVIESARLVHLSDSLTTLDSDVDTFKANLYRAGHGYIWTIGADGSLRRAEGRIANMPQLTLGMMPHALPTTITFHRYTLWGLPNGINVNQLITSNGQSFNVNNPGKAIVTAMVMRLRSNNTTGFNNPQISNNSYGPQFTSNRDAVSANSEIKLDTTIPSVEWSDNDGASYIDDFSNYLWPGGIQPLLSFALWPGNNNIIAGNNGTPNYQLVIVADAPFY